LNDEKYHFPGSISQPWFLFFSFLTLPILRADSRFFGVVSTLPTFLLLLRADARVLAPVHFDFEGRLPHVQIFNPSAAVMLFSTWLAFPRTCRDVSSSVDAQFRFITKAWSPEEFAGCPHCPFFKTMSHVCSVFLFFTSPGSVFALILYGPALSFRSRRWPPPPPKIFQHSIFLRLFSIFPPTKRF